MPKKIKRNKLLPPAMHDVVYVNSSTYGKHTRAARGSKTPAVVNNILATYAAKTSALNVAAKSVYDVLKLYSEGFREGQLWQHILSRMRKAASMNFEDLLYSLDGLEINSRYALKRFGSVPMLTIQAGRKEVLIEMKPVMPPCLNKHDNCYQYEIIVLLFNSKGICVQHAVQATGWFNEKEIFNKHVFNFDTPVKVKYYLLCLALQGGINGIARDIFASKGMRIVGASNQ